jgi:hypothetical protein
MQNIFKFDAVNSIRNIRITTQRLARVMKKDSLNRKRDYNQISELNFRLKRVIPIIPLGLGAAGTIAGGMVSSGFPFIPKFRYFSPFTPPKKPPKGPGRKPDDKKPPGEEPQTSDATEPVPNPQPGGVQLPETPEVQVPEQSQEPVFPPAPPPVPEKEREGAGVFEPALISEKLKEIYGEQLPEVFEAEPEIPQILPLEPIAPTEKEKELPPPLRLIQGFLDTFKLNELARGTTRLTLGQDGSQQKIREILELTTNDQKVAELIVQAFGLSTSLIPIIKLGYNLIPIGPAKYKKLFTVVRYIVNAARQGNLSKARIETIKGDIRRYVQTGSFFRGVPDAQRIQSSRAIERQGAMRAQGVDRSSPAQTYQNIFGQTEFARKIQQTFGDSFPKFKPTQGKNVFDPEFRLFEFNVKDLGTIIPFDTPIPKFPKFTDKIFSTPRNIPKKITGGEPIKVKPSRVRLEDQLQEAGAIPGKDGDFIISPGLSGAEKQQLIDAMRGLQSSVPDTLIQPVIIIRGTAA